MAKQEQRSTVEVDGRRLSVSNLDKVLYPEAGFTKAEVVDYYVRIAPVLLPHVADRPMSFQRFPDGVETKGFFAKNAPPGTPDWVRRVTLPAPGSTKSRETLDYVVVEDLPTLVWAANLAALELHVPQWTVGPRGAVRESDRLVLDLDPGSPATIVECAEVALLLKDLCEADGLAPLAKTSGSKGMQVSASIRPASDERTSDYAHQLAKRLEKERPDLVVSRMAKNLRGGKVFVDWSQNNAAKTTVAPYALRARPQPWVSTPITWDEVAGCRKPADLQFVAGQTLERVEEHGDLWKPLLGKGSKLP
jgi:bifunctional non-homologous end joining protein LigD